MEYNEILAHVNPKLARLDVGKLAKICAALASTDSAERANAAERASAQLYAADVSWHDVIESAVALGLAAGSNCAQGESSSYLGIEAWPLVRRLHTARGKLSAWEAEFVAQLYRRGRRVGLTVPQWATVLTLAASHQLLLATVEA